MRIKREGRGKQPPYWELRVYVGRNPATGKDRMVSRGFRGTKREAENELNEFVGEVIKGQHKHEAGTVAWLLDRWLEHIEQERSPTTMRGYRNKINRYVLPEFGKMDVRKVTALDLDELYHRMSRVQRLSPATVGQVHAILRRAFNQAVRWKLIPSSPAVDATPPRRVRADVHPPTPAEVVKLIAAADEWDDEWAVLVRLAATSGARRGELCALRRSSFSGDYRTVTIDKAVVPVDGGLQIQGTKTHAGRCVAIDARTAAKVKARFAMLERRAADSYAELDPDPYLFADEARLACDVPRHPDNVSHRFRALCEKAGVSCRLHDLRHFTATQMIAAGVDVRSVAGRLGHAQPSTTLNVYSSWVQAKDADAADLLARVLDAKPRKPRRSATARRG